MENKNLAEIEILKKEIKIIGLENRLKTGRFSPALSGLLNLKIVSEFLEKEKLKLPSEK
jgi:hypothetical protein